MTRSSGTPSKQKLYMLQHLVMLLQHRTPLHCIRHDEYTVGWVCALPIERYAAQKMLDETHAESYRTNNDTNIYTLGCINRHNVVIACLPSSQMGTNSAAAVAAQMRSTFPSIEFGLMVGIGGGVPSKGRDIRLGDVVVGLPTELNGGVVQYDYGKSTQNGFQRTGFLNAPPTLLLNGISLLRATGDHNPISTTLVGHISGLDRWPEFSRQAAGPDILFEADYTHVGGVSCESCDPKKTVERRPYERGAVVHYGTIASGNQVIRDATERDRLSSQLGGVLCFEMEAAGLMNHYPCLVIRGICDYADSHKNKRWQPYAAGTAAAFAKEVLSVVPPLDASRLPVAQRGQLQQFESLSASLERSSTKIPGVLMTRGLFLPPGNVTDEPNIASFEAAKSRSAAMTSLIVQHEMPNTSRGVPCNRIPYSENIKFTGREQELHEIHRILSAREPSATSNAHRSVVIHGLGGMGKTEIALKYAISHRVEFATILWLAAETQQKLLSSYAEAAITLRLASSGERFDENQAARDVVRWLRTSELTWLVVLDNVPEENPDFIVQEYWPSGPMGSTLVTTRNSAFGRKVGASWSLELGPLDDYSAIRILTAGLDENLDEQNLEHSLRICHRLGNLPLAISQMASYILETGCDLASFLEIYNDKRNQIEIQGAGAPESTVFYRYNLATMWSMTFSSLQRVCPDSIQTLNLMVFFDPDGIPMDLLEANPPVESLLDDYSYMGNGFKAQESRRILQVYSLIWIDRKQRQVKIHRIVQENAMIHLSKDQAAKAFITAAKLLHRAFPSLRLLKSHDIMTQRKICSKYCEHILAMLKCFDDLHVDVEPFRELTELIEIVFWYCRSNGSYRTAIPLYDTCAAIYQRGGDGCLYHACQLRFNVGHMYRNSDNAIEALRIFHEAYCLLQRAVELERIPPEHPDIANALTDIGVALVQLQRYEEAEEWQDKGIAMSLRIKPDQLPSMLCVNKSWCLWKLGRLDEASELLERVQQNCRIGHPTNSHLRRVYSFSLRVLGNVRIAQGRLDEAFAIHEEAFDVHRQLFGDKHFETGVLSYRLGCHLQDRNHMDEALVYYRAALTIFQNNSVSMTSSIIRTKYKLGCLLQQLEQEEATKLRMQAAKEREALHKIPSTEQDNMEAYDNLVPYWAW